MLRRRSSTPGKQMPLKTVFSKFMDFLGSSMWTLSIATFIEQKSIVFDREQGNPDTYQEVHKEFSSFVDTLIECFCEDLKITPQNLVDSLKSNDNKKLTKKEKQLLEPVVAAQDYDVFVPMMMRKNVELQLQALHMIEQLLEPVVAAQDYDVFVPMMMRKNVELQLQALHMIEVMCGLLPTVLTVEEDEETQRVLADADETERYILLQVLQQSKAEWEADMANRAKLQKQFEDAIKESLLDRARLMAMKESEEKAISDAINVNIKTFADLKIGAADKDKSKDGESSQASKAKTDEASKAKAVEVEKSNEKEPLKKTLSKEAEKSERQALKDRVKTPGPNQIGKVSSRPSSKSASRSSQPDVEEKPKDAEVEEKEIPKKRPSTSKGRKPLGEVKPPKGPLSPALQPEEEKPKATPFDYKSLLRDSGGGINEEAVKARAQYLKEQRDKLLALKQQEREKQFHDQEAKNALERPKTAKFARGALRGVAVARPVDDDILESRKAVASKLKSEVIKS
uniref:Cilia- and flagella-associated protein 36 n=1 Tax=Steinernema glaseri TaxID=37863 RepID=A0A1I7Y1W1_9BILA